MRSRLERSVPRRDHLQWRHRMGNTRRVQLTCHTSPPIGLTFGRVAGCRRRRSRPRPRVRNVSSRENNASSDRAARAGFDGRGRRHHEKHHADTHDATGARASRDATSMRIGEMRSIWTVVSAPKWAMARITKSGTSPACLRIRMLPYLQRSQDRYCPSVVHADTEQDRKPRLSYQSVDDGIPFS
jgi:hypothetical protein